MPSEKEVIIKVYVESRNPRSDREKDPIKRINPRRCSLQHRVFRTGGYDRRAQLLAYAQELRQVNAGPLQLHFENSRRKPKKRRWKVAVERIRGLFSRFGGMKRKWRYESIVTEDYICSDGEGSCQQERRKKSRKGRRGGDSRFCKKIDVLVAEDIQGD